MTDLTRNNIAACQVHKELLEELFIPELASGLVRFNPDSYDSVQENLGKVLSACAPHAFLAILPETSVPIDLIPYLCKQAAKLKLTIIAGLEHKITWLPSSAKEKDYRTGAYTVENSLVVVWPDRKKNVEYGKKNFPAIVKAHSVVEQIERNVEPEFLIVTVPAPDGQEIKVWPILCSDFLELVSDRIISHDELDRTICEEDVDLIAVLSHTERVDPFRSTMEQLLAGSLRRPLPTNIVFTNLACYGGSMCLSYIDRKAWRESPDRNSAFWTTRMLPQKEETYCPFPSWNSAVDEARRARKT